MEQAPGRVVEVLSPTSSSIERVKKPRRYGEFGVPEYWVLIWRPAAGPEPLELACEEMLRPF